MKSFERFIGEREAEVICLEKNYRSAPEILKTACQVLGNPDSLEPVKGPGFPVRLVRTSGEMAEAIFVAKEINRLVGGIDMLDMEEGFLSRDNRTPRSFKDIGVLYRTHRQADLLEKCLKKEGIPYIVAGREDFLSDPQVRGSLAFFRSVLDEGDDLARRRCLKLLWNVEEGCISQCAYDAMADKYRKLCRRGKPQNIIGAWREDMGFAGSIPMEKLSGAAMFYKSVGEMLENLAFGQESDLKRCGGKTYAADAVTLMTLHGSKGLEFPAVILYGVKKGIIPLEYFGTETDAEEEKRLFYVGITRAKEELIMTESGESSVFTKGLPDGTILRESSGLKNSGWSGRQISMFDFMK